MEERPNEEQGLSRTVWEFICYGPDFTTEQDDADQAGNTRENLTTIISMMKELQQQNAILQNKMLEIQNEFTLERNRRSREMIRYNSDKQHASTQFHGYSESIDLDEPAAETKRKVWGGRRRKNIRNFGTQSPCVEDFSDIKSAEQDVFDDREREINENDPELKELKELHDKVEEDEYDSLDGDGGNGEKLVEDEERRIGEENGERRHSRLLLSSPEVDVCKTEIEV